MCREVDRTVTDPLLRYVARPRRAVWRFILLYLLPLLIILQIGVRYYDINNSDNKTFIHNNRYAVIYSHLPALSLPASFARPRALARFTPRSAKIQFCATIYCTFLSFFVFLLQFVTECVTAYVWVLYKIEYYCRKLFLVKSVSILHIIVFIIIRDLKKIAPNCYKFVFVSKLKIFEWFSIAQWEEVFRHFCFVIEIGSWMLRPLRLLYMREIDFCYQLSAK